MNERKKKSTPKWFNIVLVLVALMAIAPGGLISLLTLAISVGIFALPIWLIIRVAKKSSRRQPQQNQTYSAPEEPEENTAYFYHQPQAEEPRYYSGAEPWKNSGNDCPNWFCRHKDKGEHHLRRGKEIDPWDRPDVDIRKYQHK